MRVAVVLEHRFERTPDGRVWTDGPFPYSFFTRYLEGFDAVRVLARVQAVEAEANGRLRADGDAVEFFDVPCYRGLRQYLSRRGAVRRSIEAGLEPTDAVILRVPSQVAVVAGKILRRRGTPFAAEVVGDPCDALAAGSFEHPLRPLLRVAHQRALAWQCRRAAATAYVTASALQRRYPPAPGSPTTHYSSVELRDEAFVETPPAAPAEVRLLLSVGSMEHLYKGHDTLIEALARVRERGLEMRLTLVGDGRFRATLEERARRMGVREAVTFAGQEPSGEAVRRRIDAADVFVLASRQEGLPRALLEAMARGLPAIATRVGGIPELLADEDLVPRDDPAALAQALEDVAGDAARREGMASRNLATAREYHDLAMSRRRRELYSAVRRLVEAREPAGGSPRMFPGPI